MIEAHDVQGLLFSGYGKQPHAAYVFLSIRNAVLAARWIGERLTDVTTGGAHRNRPTSLNLALTSKGLAALGLSRATLETFPRAFVEDMSQPDRARILGDTLSEWEWGLEGHRIHVLLMLFADEVATLESLLQRQLDAGRPGLEELFVIRSSRLPADIEHFGFADGLTQPVFAEMSRDGAPEDRIRTGEFILGYDNEYGQRTVSPTLAEHDPGSILLQSADGKSDLGRNGSYLVLRQMEQNVTGFWRMLEKECLRADGTPDRQAEVALAAKIIGRWPDGSPLSLFPDTPPVPPQPHAVFQFDSDRLGDRCPLGAHIRRANPRDALLDKPELSVTVVKRHRLLRRGRVYGPPLADRYTDDGQKRGLLFIAFNANIERQFEFIQSAWISSPNFAGLYEEGDPLLGGRLRTQGRFTIPGSPVRCRLSGIHPFVTVRGGGYFFLPGIRTLRYLARSVGE